MGWVGYFSTPETALGGVLPHAWLLTHDPKYLAGALRATQFGAGANPDNRAYTTGLGPDPVRFPLHVDCAISGQPAPAGITVYGGGDPVEDFGDAWVHTWYLQKMLPSSRTWPAYEGSYYDIHVSPPTNEYTIHQTIIPTAFYWGFLAARR
jgi:endoglucanase